MNSDTLLTNINLIEQVTVLETYSPESPNFKKPCSIFDEILLENHRCCYKVECYDSPMFVWCGKNVCDGQAFKKCIVKKTCGEWEELFSSKNKYNITYSNEPEPKILYKSLLVKVNDISKYTDADIPYFNNVVLKNGHKCNMRCGMKAPYKYTWCGQNGECEEVKCWDDMHNRQKEEDDCVNQLVANGHTCISILECYPSRHSWCGQTPCIKK